MINIFAWQLPLDCDHVSDDRRCVNSTSISAKSHTFRYPMCSSTAAHGPTTINGVFVSRSGNCVIVRFRCVYKLLKRVIVLYRLSIYFSLSYVYLPQCFLWEQQCHHPSATALKHRSHLMSRRRAHRDLAQCIPRRA